MNRIHIVLTAAMAALGASLLSLPAMAEQATAKLRAANTWLHLSEVVARPDGCKTAVAGRGILTFGTANGLRRAAYLALPTETVGQHRSSLADGSLTEPLALLSAYIVRPDGSPDPAFGAQPRDIVILTTGDGRVIVTFTDFSADPDAGTYLYPGSVAAPVSQMRYIPR